MHIFQNNVFLTILSSLKWEIDTCMYLCILFDLNSCRLQPIQISLEHKLLIDCLNYKCGDPKTCIISSICGRFELNKFATRSQFIFVAMLIQ